MPSARRRVALDMWNWSRERKSLRHNNCIYVLFAECDEYEMIGSKWVASRLIELVSKIYINFISIIHSSMYLIIFVQTNNISSLMRKVNCPETVHFAILGAFQILFVKYRKSNMINFCVLIFLLSQIMYHV